MSDSKHNGADETVMDDNDENGSSDNKNNHDDVVGVSFTVSDNEPRMSENNSSLIDDAANNSNLDVSDIDKPQSNVSPKMVLQYTNTGNNQNKDLSAHLDVEKNTNVYEEQNTDITNNLQPVEIEEKPETSQSISQLLSKALIDSPENASAGTSKETEFKNASTTDTVHNSSNETNCLKRPLVEDEFKPKKHRQSYKDKSNSPKLDNDGDKLEDFELELSEDNPKVPPLKIVIPITDDDMSTNSKNGNIALPYIISPVELSASSSKPNSPKSQQIANSSTVNVDKNLSTQPGTLRSYRCENSSNHTSPVVLELLQLTTSSTTITTESEITNLSMTAHPAQTRDDTQTIDSAADTESTSTSESPKSLSTIRQLINKWSEHYFKDYIGIGLYNPRDKNEIIYNDYQLLFILKKQIDDKRKKLFAVHPKPPSGFKDYLLNRRTYILANNSNSSVVHLLAPPPANLHEQLKQLFVEQEKERQKLGIQHIVEKEKLVLSVEQEILRVHGRAARALANQQFPFSVCTILNDEELCHIKDSNHLAYENRQHKYNGRIFLSWLQELDDKWENIKESMLFRHHNEADSLHALQKMYWEWKLKELPLSTYSVKINIDEEHVPIVPVSDDFDLLPF